MGNKLKGMVLVAVSGFVLMGAAPALANGLESLPGMQTTGVTTATHEATTLIDAPALNIECDDRGRVHLDLPALRLHSEAGHEACPRLATVAPRVDPVKKVVRHAHRHAPHRLPVTGVNVGDFFAMGLAALSGGGVLLRRLKLSLSS